MCWSGVLVLVFLLLFLWVWWGWCVCAPVRLCVRLCVCVRFSVCVCVFANDTYTCGTYLSLHAVEDQHMTEFVCTFLLTVVYVMRASTQAVDQCCVAQSVVCGLLRIGN